MVRKDDLLYKNRNKNIWFCTKCTKDIFPYNNIEDEHDFIMALSENWVNDIPFQHFPTAENLFFSPFDLNENHDLPLSDADPDIQFYKHQCNSLLNSCDYYHEDSFNKKLTDMNISDGRLSMCPCQYS